MADFSSGGILPPTSEDYKRMWEQQTQDKLDAMERLTPDQVRRKAIKEVLQDQVRRAVKPDDRLKNVFEQNIDRHLRGR